MTKDSVIKNTVCIGFAEALSAPEVAWSLVDAGFEVIVFARKGRRSALRHSSRVALFEVTPPESDYKSAQAELEQFLTKQNLASGERGVILPLDDTAVWLFDRLRTDPCWVLAGPQGPMVDLALDKEFQVGAAHSAGLKVPSTTIAKRAAEVSARRKELPLVLRPAKAISPIEGHLRKGRNWICATQAELDEAISQWAETYPLMVQPFIQGHGEGIFGLATEQGVQAWSAHRRLRMMNPHGSGSCACISQAVPAECKLAIEKLVQQTGWRGIFMVELLRDPAGMLWFVEFNGRAWGSMALSRRQGLEYPAWAVKTALDPHYNIKARTCGEIEIVCRNAGREFMHVLFVLRGPKSKALKEWPTLWRTMVELLRVRHNHFLYNWRSNDRKVFFSDWWCTVRNNLCKSKG